MMEEAGMMVGPVETMVDLEEVGLGELADQVVVGQEEEMR